MEVRKAVITAAGRGARLYPVADTVHKAMLPIVDRDGVPKPVIQVLAEEALLSGIEELCLICAPGDEPEYRAQFQGLQSNLLLAHKGAQWAQAQADRISDILRRLRFAAQDPPLGFGHAVSCAQEFAAGAAFLLMISDHLFLSHDPKRRCAQQLMELATQEGCPVSAVHPTPEHLIGNYGTFSGKRCRSLPGAYQVERVMEKPSVSQAELYLATTGLRAGYYLCSFGLHVLSPAIFEILAEQQRAQAAGGAGVLTRPNKADADIRAPGGPAELELTPALQELARRGKYLALEIRGTRFDIGRKLGFLRAQLALGLASPLRDQVLATLVESLAEDRMGSAPQA
jgi:UTP--glucose-1-phosphate uridylyltransferase